MGEKLIFTFEVIVDEGFSDSGFFGDLKGGGSVKTLTREKRGRCFDQSLLFLHR